MQAGAFDKALDLLAAAEAGPPDEFASARVDLLRGQIAFATGKSSEAPSLLLRAAKRLEPLDLGLARETYVHAWMAANLAGRLAGAGDMPEISRAARALPPPKQPARPLDLLLEALSLLVTDGPAAAAPALQQAVRAFSSADLPLAERLQSGWMAAGAANALWDWDGWHAILARQVQLARDAGALEHLPIDLASLAMAEAWRGDFAEADSLIAECDTVCEATGSRIVPYAALFVAALRGNQAEAIPLGEAAITAAEAAGHESQARFAHYATAILHNGLRRYAGALAAAEQATRDAHLYVSMWALPELIEAAVRTGNVQIAADALERLAETTQAGGTDFGLGIETRCRALLSDGEQAGLLYREAIARLGRTRMRPELARAHLLYGEWLRRQLRHTEARAQLRAACQLLEATGMEGFAERARRELRAAGVAACRRPVTTTAGLTAQEAQIARLAAEGLSNPEIGARLFLSPRTVQYHLGKIFTKLDITSRAQLSPRPARQLGFDPPPMGPERSGRADPA
jgi:DNA-binding CsgD family transcriptional regulator